MISVAIDISEGWIANDLSKLVIGCWVAQTCKACGKQTKGHFGQTWWHKDWIRNQSARLETGCDARRAMATSSLAELEPVSLPVRS